MDSFGFLPGVKQLEFPKPIEIGGVIYKHHSFFYVLKSLAIQTEPSGIAEQKME